MPEGLLLRLDEVDKEGTGTMITYVYRSPLLVFTRPSSSCVFSGSLANYRRGLRCSRPTSKRSTHNNPLAVSSLPVRPDLPDDPVMPYNGFATVEGERVFFHLLRKENIDANLMWD